MHGLLPRHGNLLSSPGPHTAALRELIGHFRAEYDAFLTRWGDVPRSRPPMPTMYLDEEKRRWTEMVEADLARHPTWGDEIRRRYAREMEGMPR